MSSVKNKVTTRRDILRTGDVEVHTKASGPKRMAFRLQSTTGINNILPSIRDISAVNQLMRLTRFTQPKRIIRDKLVCGETIMQLYDADLVSAFARRKASVCEDLVGTDLGHGVPSNGHGALAFKSGGVIGDEGLGNYLDGLVLELVRVHEGFRGDYVASGTVLSR